MMRVILQYILGVGVLFSCNKYNVDLNNLATENKNLPLNNINHVPFLTQLGNTTLAKEGFDNLGTNYCKSVAVDFEGNVYCAGSTVWGSTSEANGGFSDAFIMKLNSFGVVQWHTQLGDVTKVGISNDGWDSCYGVAVDTTGNVYCAGETSGSMSEVNGGHSDAFVMKLNSDGVVQWHTQLGQNTLAKEDSSNAENDFCWGVAVDISGNVYCAGETYGHLGEINADNTNNADAFVMKLTPNGEILATP